jgi:hypothetical protein
VEGINMVNEAVETVKGISPYEEDIINVPPPDPREARSSVQHGFL